METIIQKAAKGSRQAMTQLYESNAATVYCLSKALLRGGDQAVPAANWAIKSAFQEVQKGTIQTEAEFSAFAVKQAAGYCKKEVIKKDPRAFKLPPKKEFLISHVNEWAMDPNAGDVENYIQCLPAIQRFTFALRHLGNMDDMQIARVIGFDMATAQRIKDTENDNLEKIRRALKSAGGHCDAPTNETVSAGFARLKAHTQIPEAVAACIDGYIDTVAAPIEAASKNKNKRIGVIAAVVLACAVILVVMISGTGRENTATSDDGDYYETSSTDTSDGAEDTESDELNPALTYYADIEIADYGTVTVQLDQASAPITAANFVKLAQSGFYDGLTFHRVVEGFVIQGGDPDGDGTGGSDETIVGEFTANGYDNDLSHTRGAISMARSNDYDSASSQFFIVHEDSTESLDGLYAAFGYVIEGMDVVDAICEAAEPIDSVGLLASEDQPVITSVTIRTESPEAE